jgi:hypothetical protein
MKAETIRVPITVRSLIERINRVLAADDRIMKRARGKLALAALGHFYIVDTHKAVVARNIKLEEFARELGTLQVYEQLIGD